jgi:integrase
MPKDAKARTARAKPKPLEDTQIRNAMARAKDYKLADTDGLFLHVQKTGHRSWRYRTEIKGREKVFTLGTYPELSLKAARRSRDAKRVEAQAVKSSGPAAAKFLSEPLATVAARYLTRKSSLWSVDHRKELSRRLETHIYPTLGDLPVRDIQGVQILRALRVIEDAGSIDLAHRIRGLLSNIFGFAIGEGLAADNPAEGIKAALAPVPVWKHRPAVTTLDDARTVLRKVESIAAHPVIRLCMRFMALTAQRPGECAGAEWSEFLGVTDVWSEPTWVIPRERKGVKRGNTVPLSRQTVEVINAVRRYSGRLMQVFPSTRNDGEGLSNNALRYLLLRAGMVGVQVPHGWRATFSTVMNGLYPQDRLPIDLMLAHVSKGAVEAAYNRQEHMERRRELAQEWADLLLRDAPSASELLEPSLAKYVSQ